MHALNLRNAFGFLHLNEMLAMQNVVAGLAENAVVVNFGAGAGTSGLAFVEAHPTCKVYTIDIQDEASPFGSLEGERNAFRNAGLMRLLNRRWFQIHGDSKEVGRAWLDKEMPRPDFVFVDGDHTYAGAYGDIEAWWFVLRPGGYMAIHDYEKHLHDPTEHGRANPYGDVDRAVSDFFDKHPKAERHLQVDTTVIFKKG